ncbi:MAG: hypothetical protein KDC18_02680 [Alphaproteobacteria bacterium]|nr:hypothetical protein [Alphaproteobacteria bacterium]MCB9930189.1 hypothetical protein [Alphaproteobacteria bacterium]
MPPKHNPLKLNALQLKTLTVLQQLARFPQYSNRDAETGEAVIMRFPHAHGDHFHCGDAVVLSRDATGLQNEKVWRALERKGLARPVSATALALSAAGEAYDTGLSDRILHRADH